MKKLLPLLLLLITGISAFSQINRIVTPQTKLTVVKGAHLISPLIRPNNNDIQLQAQNPLSLVHHNPAKSSSLRGLTTTFIGTTIYDLQTNGSTSTRLWNNGGKLSATWTYSNGDPASNYLDRGTGYNYFLVCEYLAQ